MRDFMTVIKEMIDISRDEEFTKRLQKIYKNASYTAPELTWKLRGPEVSDLLSDYVYSKKNTAQCWLMQEVCLFSTLPEPQVRQHLEEQSAKFNKRKARNESIRS